MIDVRVAGKHEDVEAVTTGKFGRLGALRLSVTNTVLIYVLVPLAIVLVVTGLTFAGGGEGRAKRYRPGRAYTYPPIWFVSAPDQVTTGGDATVQPQGSSAVAGSGRTAAIESGTVATPSAPRPKRATGGASDRW